MAARSNTPRDENIIASERQVQLNDTNKPQQSHMYFLEDGKIIKVKAKKNENRQEVPLI